MIEIIKKSAVFDMSKKVKPITLFPTINTQFDTLFQGTFGELIHFFKGVLKPTAT